MKQYEDDKRIQTSDNLNQNYYLRLDKSITPLISYQLYLRTNLTNSHTTDSQDKTTKTYQRAIEPALDLSFRNPIYGLDVGTRRLEQWSTANLSDDSRRTTEFYYARLNIRPHDLPSLSLQFDRQKDYDHLSERKIDTTNNRYSGSSWYDVLYKDLRLAYNLTYTRNESKTPIGTISKTINDSLNGLYNLGYNKSFWHGSVNVSAGYQGNYVRNKTEQFATQTVSVTSKRTAWHGLYVYDNSPSITDKMESDGTLIDVNYDKPAASNINLSTQKGQNIGIDIWLSSRKNVDKLYIYVNKDISMDSSLNNPASWEVYKIDTDADPTFVPTTWSEVPIRLVSGKYDSLHNRSYYEIELLQPTTARCFKAVNIALSGITDVLVTEIEAYGTDIVQEGWSTDVSTFFTQGINLNAILRPVRRLTFSLDYFLNRSDQNPESIFDSISGAFANMFSEPEEEKDKKLKSNITRTHGASSTWLTHRLLTTTVRFQRNEAFDNKDEMDNKSDTYSLVFSLSPLPTLDANLSFIRTYTYDFNEKRSMNNLYLFTISSKLYRDVNMITDLGYTQSKTYAVDHQNSTAAKNEDTESSTRYIRGMLDARLTQKLSTNLTFGLSRTSGNTSSRTNDGTLIITYRPGRFINLSGNVKISDIDGDTSTSEGFFIDWLILPAIRMNLSYMHSNTEPDSTTIDTISGYLMWYITRFLNFQFTYSYTRNVKEKKTETYNLGGNLTCRFW